MPLINGTLHCETAAALALFRKMTWATVRESLSWFLYRYSRQGRLPACDCNDLMLLSPPGPASNPTQVLAKQVTGKRTNKSWRFNASQTVDESKCSKEIKMTQGTEGCAIKLFLVCCMHLRQNLAPKAALTLRATNAFARIFWI